MSLNPYYTNNKEILDKLQNDTYIEEVHGCEMHIKEVPDKREDTALDPRIYEERKKAKQAGNPFAEVEEVTPEMMRAVPEAETFDVTDREISRVERTIVTRNGETSIFIYNGEEGKTKPMMLFIHGGAFVAGKTAVVENFCKLIAQFAGAVVVGVDYRLSPEHLFPVGLHDCYDTLDYMYTHAKELGGDPKRISVGGDSAGATLAIGCCMLEQERVQSGELEEYRIGYEALIYPAVLVDNFRMEDYRWRMSDYNIADNDLLALDAAVSLAAMSGFMPKWYMGKEGPIKEPLAAPLCAECLSYLPKTTIALCEFDYLRLQGEAFARKLKREQVDTKVFLYKGMDHEFVDKVGYIPQAYDLAREVAGQMTE